MPANPYESPKTSGAVARRLWRTWCKRICVASLAAVAIGFMLQLSTLLWPELPPGYSILPDVVIELSRGLVQIAAFVAMLSGCCWAAISLFGTPAQQQSKAAGTSLGGAGILLATAGYFAGLKGIMTTGVVVMLVSTPYLLARRRSPTTGDSEARSDGE